MVTGYKWTERKSDGKLFIVTLNCNNEYSDPIVEKLAPNQDSAFWESFFSTDCKVEEIADEHGNQIDMIDGIAYYPFNYHVGQEIQGVSIFYYHDKESCMRFGKPVITQRRAMKRWLAACEKADDHSFDFYTFKRKCLEYFFKMGGTEADLEYIKGCIFIPKNIKR